MNLTLDGLSTPEGLAAVVTGLSDREAVEVITELGVQAVLDRVFDGMVERFLPARMPGGVAVVRYRINTPEGSIDQVLTLSKDGCTKVAAAGQMADVTLDTDIATLLRMVSGTLNGLQAHSDRTLRLSGDVVLAINHQTWFDVDLSNAKLNVSKPSQLARLIEGQADEVLLAGIALSGMEAGLSLVFNGMVEHFRVGRGPRSRTVMQWNIRVPEGKHIRQLVVDKHSCRHLPSPTEKPRITLSLPLPDLLRIAAGKLNPMLAVGSGRLRVGGNLLVASKAESWFDKSA